MKTSVSFLCFCVIAVNSVSDLPTPQSKAQSNAVSESDGDFDVIDDFLENGVTEFVREFASKMVMRENWVKREREFVHHCVEKIEDKILQQALKENKTREKSEQETVDEIKKALAALMVELHDDLEEVCEDWMTLNRHHFVLSESEQEKLMPDIVEPTPKQSGCFQFHFFFCVIFTLLLLF